MSLLTDEGVEKQLERAVGLRAVLRSESEQYDPTLPVARGDHGTLPGDLFFADEPPALQDVSIGKMDELLVFVV